MPFRTAATTNRVRRINFPLANLFRPAILPLAVFRITLQVIISVVLRLHGRIQGGGGATGPKSDIGEKKIWYGLVTVQIRTPSHSRYIATTPPQNHSNRIRHCQAITQSVIVATRNLLRKNSRNTREAEL